MKTTAELENKKLHDEAIAQGYKDETCQKCNVFLPAHQHFLRCDLKPCPMSNGKSFLDMWIEAAEKAEGKL